MIIKTIFLYICNEKYGDMPSYFSWFDQVTQAQYIAKCELSASQKLAHIESQQTRYCIWGSVQFQIIS